MYLLRSQELGDWPDPRTDPRLLPGWMQREENAARRSLYHTAVVLAIERFLTKEQRALLHMRYWQGLTMTEIGERLGISGSGASKRLAGVLDLLKEHALFCAEVQETLEQRGQTE